MQEVQDSSKKMVAQLRTLERQLEAERQAMTNQQTYTGELETSLQTKAEDAQREVRNFNLRLSFSSSSQSPLK